ncbi:MAG TPA: hypothetical protein PKD86_02145, partial [Gemmatales bacterium]|nr:hypothetical protein [Gemmatales bacterium]HMP58130.1 hypothetical protein [Gemmatales bacterium]
MRGLLLGGLITLVLGLAGCQSAETVAVTPRPPDAPPLTFPELVTLSKNQVAAAHEFFYQDKWDQVRQAATALRDTSNHLGQVQPDAIPQAQRGKLPELTKELTAAATLLHSAADEKDVDKTSEAFRRLHLVVRQLRTD